MGKVIAIDYGEKRCGIAETDDLKIIASALTTVNTKELFPFLEKYFQKNNVEELVLGIAPNHNNQLQAIESHIQKFIAQFEKKFPNIIIKRIDERFTSKMAFQTMIDSGIGKKKRRDKSLIDKISATIILQTYLNQNSSL